MPVGAMAANSTAWYAKIVSKQSIPYNRYRAPDNSISLNTVRTEHGWRIDASISGKISANDRVKLIQWFHDYRSKLRQLHPLWITRFSSSPTGYTLDIRPMQSMREVAEKGEDLKSIWTDEVANRA